MAMKYLITGCFGFVGSYLIEHIRKEYPDATIVGVDRIPQPDGWGAPNESHRIDLLDRAAIARVVGEAQPDYVVHLASFSSVAFSWQDPVASFTNNTNIFLNLLECIRAHAPKARILSVGSSEEYGVVSSDELPLRESTPLRPVSPYAVARVSQEQLGDVYVRGYGLDIVATRSFNHVGPGQTDKFVVSALAHQFAEVACGKRTSISVGETSVTRDFLDVRDVVRAYAGLLVKGKQGEVYNVCSGRGITIDGVIKLYERIAGIAVKVVRDPALVRPVENPVVVGTHYKLATALGWEPRFSLERSLSDVYEHWKTRI
jgi:GDP-4-dehydro-6-deoxy-D-mannose reductase